MKVAILSPIAWRTPPLKYGPWEQMASNLTEGLSSKGVDVTLFATSDSYTTGKLNAVVKNAYEENKSLDPKVEECLHISNLMELAKDFDIIHNHYDFLPLTYSKLVDTPIITTIHGFSSEKILKVYKKYDRHTNYISISNANRHPDLNYLSTIYHGIDFKHFEFEPVKKDYLLFFGRIHPDKGTKEAIQIALKTNRKLIIAGLIQDQAYFRELEKFIDGDQIMYIGNVGSKKRNQLLGQAQALLHLIQFDEPFGLSVVEAMACGTPVIAYRRGSMPEIIKDKITGFLVNNQEEALEAISYIQNIKAENCRSWIKSKFTINIMVDQYIRCYHQILNGKSRFRQFL